MSKVSWTVASCLLLLMLLPGCAQKKYNFEYGNPGNNLVWPQPPETPRYQFLGFIQGETNFVLDKSTQSFVGKSLDWLGEFVFGKAKSQGLYRPQGVYFDNLRNRLYVSDIGKKAVFVFDLNQNQLKTWEQVDEENRFSSPVGIAVDKDQNVFVSDSALGFVVKFDAEGKAIAKWGQNILQRPTGLAIDSASQRLYVADAQAHKILVFTSKGEVAFQIGGSKSERQGFFNSPTYLTIANNKLFVSDTLNARIQVLDLNGKWLNTFGKRGMYIGNLPRPKGIALDSENHVYVVESYYDHLLIFDENGKPLLPIGGNGKQAGQFNLPAGIWIDGRDRIYVADMFNSRIGVFQYLKQK